MRVVIRCTKLQPRPYGGSEGVISLQNSLPFHCQAIRRMAKSVSRWSGFLSCGASVTCGEFEEKLHSWCQSAASETRVSKAGIYFSCAPLSLQKKKHVTRCSRKPWKSEVLNHYSEPPEATIPAQNYGTLSKKKNLSSKIDSAIFCMEYFPSSEARKFRPQTSRRKSADCKRQLLLFVSQWLHATVSTPQREASLLWLLRFAASSESFSPQFFSCAKPSPALPPPSPLPTESKESAYLGENTGRERETGASFSQHHTKPLCYIMMLRVS